MKNLIVSLFVAILFAAVTFGQSNISSASQIGSNNAAYVEQLGSTNTAVILSTGNNNNLNSFISHEFSVPNSVPFLSFPAPMIAKGITQHGSLNVGTVIQSWNNNKAGLAQYGNHDFAAINQFDATLSSTSYRNAWVDQLGGDGNSALVMQGGQIDASYIRQNGGSNSATVSQLGVALSDAVQEGSGNHLTQLQTGGGLDPNLNDAYSYQIGNGNYTDQKQAGSSNSSLVTAFGNNNGVSGDEFKTVQIGNGNCATIEAGLLAAVNSNLGSIEQYGSTNMATISQEAGDVNEARISQTNDSNTATVIQAGASNYATVSQLFNSNNSIVAQTGNANYTTVTQH